jgi:hypothetical protein
MLEPWIIFQVSPTYISLTVHLFDTVCTTPQELEEAIQKHVVNIYKEDAPSMLNKLSNAINGVNL